MFSRSALAGLLAVTLAACATPPAQDETPAPAPAPVAAPPPPPSLYADAAKWLCLPGRSDDACAQDQTAAAVAATGDVTREPFTPDPAAPIDCFYVYPTVSFDPTMNSDWAPGPEERSVIEQQAARFQSVCRVFAPMYRQVTLTALRAMMLGQKAEADPKMAYDDVAEAWRYYLEHHNQGRGVVLIGHSQGARVLADLVAAEIDGKPAQAKLVSAMLIGTNIDVAAPGTSSKGKFATIPTCSAKDETGCLVGYVSFRETGPPPETARFGKTAGAGLETACVNPAVLLGRDRLDAYLPSRPSAASPGSGAYPPWTVKTKFVGAPFVRLPGLLSGACVRGAGAHYLSVKVHGVKNGPRTDTIPGDVVLDGKVQADWGLHLIDMHLAMGDLVELAKVQGAAWRAKAGAP